jgi:hypothetical protein
MYKGSFTPNLHFRKMDLPTVPVPSHTTLTPGIAKKHSKAKKHGKSIETFTDAESITCVEIASFNVGIPPMASIIRS